jgi:hypothetical protein
LSRDVLMANAGSWPALMLSLGLSSGLALSCGPEIEETDEELERSCNLLCAQHERCGTEYSQTVDAADCLEDCFESVWPSACRDPHIAYQECSAALSCGDFLFIGGPEPYDPETGPCAEERVATGHCVANNR